MIGGNRGIAAGAVSEIIYPKGSHFMGFQMPKVVAGTVEEWIGKEVEGWKESEKAEFERREKVERKLRSVENDDYWYWVKKHFAKDFKKPKTKPGNSRERKRKGE